MEVWEEGCGRGSMVFCADAYVYNDGEMEMEMGTSTHRGGGGLLRDLTKEATPMGWDMSGGHAMNLSV
jgi:hypothetical protein